MAGVGQRVYLRASFTGFAPASGSFEIEMVLASFRVGTSAAQASNSFTNFSARSNTLTVEATTLTGTRNITASDRFSACI